MNPLLRQQPDKRFPAGNASGYHSGQISDALFRSIDNILSIAYLIYPLSYIRYIFSLAFLFSYYTSPFFSPYYTSFFRLLFSYLAPTTSSR